MNDGILRLQFQRLAIARDALVVAALPGQDPSQFVEARIERGASMSGPWTAVTGEAREAGGVSTVVDPEAVISGATK